MTDKKSFYKFFYWIEYKDAEYEKTKKCESYVFGTDDPTGSDVFKTFDWGVWFIDDKNNQHWIPWDKIFEISFEENCMLRLRKPS